MITRIPHILELRFEIYILAKLIYRYIHSVMLFSEAFIVQRREEKENKTKIMIFYNFIREIFIQQFNFRSNICYIKDEYSLIVA